MYSNLFSQLGVLKLNINKQSIWRSFPLLDPSNYADVTGLQWLFWQMHRASNATEWLSIFLFSGLRVVRALFLLQNGMFGVMAAHTWILRSFVVGGVETVAKPWHFLRAFISTNSTSNYITQERPNKSSRGEKNFGCDTLGMPRRRAPFGALST